MSLELKVVQNLSKRLVEAQKPIRVLDAVKWTDDIKATFFKNKCKKLPLVDKDYYASRPLGYKPEDLKDEFRAIIRESQSQLGQYAPLTQLIVPRCEEYIRALDMIEARGTPAFAELSMALYGSPNDAFIVGGPRLSELSDLLRHSLSSLSEETQSEADVKKYSAEQCVEILQEKMREFFRDKNKTFVVLSDDIISDASAGAEQIKINKNATFSDRDIRYLEVHEGWVHLSTSLNGAAQPNCTFLGKGTPATSVTQEGLAVISEIYSFSSYPQRMLKIIDRATALHLISEGANFLEIFEYFRMHGYDDENSYNHSVRLFRGSLPTLGPFTKDLSYSKGLVLIYNYIRLTIKQGTIRYLPPFFVGKTHIHEIGILADLIEEGIVEAPKFIPSFFSDSAALTAWMSFSLFLNKFDLDELEKQFRPLK